MRWGFGKKINIDGGHRVVLTPERKKKKDRDISCN